MTELFKRPWGPNASETEKAAIIKATMTKAEVEEAIRLLDYETLVLEEIQKWGPPPGNRDMRVKDYIPAHQLEAMHQRATKESFRLAKQRKTKTMKGERP